MTRILTVRRYVVRVSFIFYDSRKAYFYLTMNGPNSSASGWGPRPFLRIRGRHIIGHSISVPMPQWHFRYSFRFRRLGRWVYKPSNWNYHVMKWLERKV